MRTAGPLPGRPRGAHPEGSRRGPGLPDIPPLQLGSGARAAQQAGHCFIRDGVRKAPGPAESAPPRRRVRQRPAGGRERARRPRGGAGGSGAPRCPRVPPRSEDPHALPVSLKTLGSEPLGRRRHWPLRAKPARRASRDTRGSSPAFPRPTCSCV